jgi:addiction module HigA family antidote
MPTTTSVADDKNMRMRSPVHPGRFPRTEIIEAHALTVTQAAKILRVSRPALSTPLDAKADLPAEMALWFEKAFGVHLDALMRVQTSYDIAQTRRRARAIRVRRYAPMPACRTMTETA